MFDCQFFIHTNKGPVIMMNKLKSIYNSPFKDSHSHPIHTCFPMIASNADLGTTPPAINIWWSSLETCSNWFTWGPTSHQYWHLVVPHRNTYGWQAGDTHPSAMLTCCLCFQKQIPCMKNFEIVFWTNYIVTDWYTHFVNWDKISFCTLGN